MRLKEYLSDGRKITKFMCCWESRELMKQQSQEAVPGGRCAGAGIGEGEDGGGTPGLFIHPDRRGGLSGRRCTEMCGAWKVPLGCVRFSARSAAEAEEGEGSAGGLRTEKEGNSFLGEEEGEKHSWASGECRGLRDLEF